MINCMAPPGDHLRAGQVARQRAPGGVVGSAQARLGDFSSPGRLTDPARESRASIPAVTGSPNVMVNNRPALRVGDVGTVVAGAFSTDTVQWVAAQGARCVLINNRNAHRAWDVDDHRGCPGTIVEGSPYTFVGDWNQGSDARELTWVGIRLRREKGGHPMAGQRYLLWTPDGAVRAGFLDSNGNARIEGVPPGECKVKFPKLIDGYWRGA